MTTTSRYLSGVWLGDFEFRPASGREGNLPVPVCLVATEIRTGQTLRLWQDQLQYGTCPFPTDKSALFVAFYASAEMACFDELGWQRPVNVLDLYAESRCLTNGKPVPSGNSLLGVLTYYGLPSISAEEKTAMRELILRGGPWSQAEQEAILDYCESDVTSLQHLFPAMEPFIDWDRALLRGRYTAAIAKIENVGIPVDMNLYAALKRHWDSITLQLIATIDSNYGVYEGRSFRMARFEAYLASNGIAWPVLPSGKLNMQDQ